MPPFCPNQDCTEHRQHTEMENDWFIKRGYYHTATRGPVQRFKCKTCQRSFTERIFTLDYYAKRTDIDLQDLLFHYCNGFSQRALSDHFHCTIRTVAHRLQLLARQSMAAILDANSHISLNEDLAIDGMQNFTGSQYQPNNYNILVGQYSQYLSMVTMVIFRRAGHMTPHQKRMRTYFDRIGMWRRSDFARSIEQLVDYMFTVVESRRIKTKRTICNSDKKPMYAKMIRKHKGLGTLASNDLFTQNVTSSKRFRNIQNPLFPVNYIDNRLRNDLADWQRETTSFPREANRNFQRFLCYMGYHDFFKPHRAHDDARTHAEAAGLSKNNVERIKHNFFSVRAMHSFLQMPPQWEESWFCTLITPLQVRNGLPFNGNRVPAFLYG